MKETKDKTRTGLVPTEIPGMYTLPERLLAPHLQLSPHYEYFAAGMRARRDPFTYLKFQLGLLKPNQV